MTQFRRLIELSITDTETGDIVTIRDMAISFSVDKSLTESGNRAFIEINNLSPNTRNKLDNTEKLLLLKVGYVGSPLETLFFGNINTFFDAYKSPEIITKIECLDGERSMAEAKVSVSYKAGTSVRFILNDIITKAGWERKNNINTLEFDDQIRATGYEHLGLAKTAIEELTDMVNLEWSFQDNSIQFTTLDGLATQEIVELSKDTGLIGVPERTDKKGVKSKRRKKNKKTGKRPKSEPGYIVKSLIKPKIKPGAEVHLISQTLNLNNNFKVGDVNHSGNNFSNIWETRMKLLLPRETTLAQPEATAGALA